VRNAMRLELIQALTILVVAASSTSAQEVRLPVTRDTWFSNVGSEANGNNGAAPRLKLKSNQEMSVIDVDPAPLRGRVVTSATLHLRSVGEPRLLRVTVGSFGADWVEGTASGYEREAGSSTHNRRRHPDVPWTIPGSDLCSVILGQGGTTWRMADATPPDTQGWQRIAVDPAIIAARVAGISYGFFLFDDTGSEWTRQGEKFTPHHMPNRFVYSKDSNRASAPYLTVTLGAKDSTPPLAPERIELDPADLPAGEAWVSWTTPRDDGPAGTVGFLVRVDGKEVPRYLIPLARKPGERVRMRLRDLALAPGAAIRLGVRAVDGAGNVGREVESTARVSARIPIPLPGTSPKPFEGRGPLPRLGGAEVAVVDELD
jgi:3D (Asp-Asp-Asp) domain-containing protein